METRHRLAGLAGAAGNVALGCGLSAALAADAAVTAAKHGNWVFELAVGVIISAAALLRGRGRLLAAAAGLAVAGLAGVAGDVWRLSSQPGIAATLGLLVLGAAAVRTAHVRPAALIAAGGVAVMVAGRVAVRPEDIVPLSFLGVLAWGGALAVGARLRLGDISRQAAVDAARRDERLELARELHDVVAHHVAGIVVQAQAARVVAARQPETLDGMLAGIDLAGQAALDAMRRVVGLLRDAGDSQPYPPGPQQLSELVSRFSGHGPEARLSLPPAGQPPWPPEVAVTVYRVVQEALTNITLHARDPAHVTVTVAGDPGGVRVEVTDDGAPGPSWLTVRDGHGLAGMRERVGALGGTLRAGPHPGGWAVRATVPLAAGSAVPLAAAGTAVPLGAGSTVPLAAGGAA